MEAIRIRLVDENQDDNDDDTIPPPICTRKPYLPQR